MVLKKPYAFLIKYFKIINLVLVLLFSFLAYRLYLIRNVISEIYFGKITNYSSLNYEYIGFKMFLLMFFIITIIGVILLLLFKKKKPLNDYLYGLIYLFVIVCYLLFVTNLFFTLNETIIEQVDLRLYRDIAFLIIIPLVYFIIKYLLLVIGFNINKFNFTNDIIELQQDEKDNEEVEINFDKNTYKYKRKIRRSIREFKYYLLENKFILTIILSVIVIAILFTFFSINLFNKDKVRVNENFNAGGFNYRILNVYETEYDLNYNKIKDDSKFVIMMVNVRNNSIASSIDFKRIRLLFDNDYVYANNYFNKYFLDYGVPYDNQILKTNEPYNYIFIFKVPKTYNSNKYVIKFYDRLLLEDNDFKGSYKEINVKAKEDNKDRNVKNLSLNENVIFNKNKYGNSNFTLMSYDIKSNYVYKTDNISTVVRDKDINKKLLIVDYILELDDNYMLSDYFVNHKDFFNKFVSISYYYNGKEKTYNKIEAIGNVDNKIMLSIPFEIEKAESINFILNFRDVKIVYKLK